MVFPLITGIAGLIGAVGTAARGISSIRNAFRSPSQMGADTYAYNQAAYPGTTPWEQLAGGATGASAQSPGSSDRQNTTDLVKQVIASKTELEKTKMQTEATKDVAQIQTQPVQGRLDLDTQFRGEEVDIRRQTSTAQERDSLTNQDRLALDRQYRERETQAKERIANRSGGPVGLINEAAIVTSEWLENNHPNIGDDLYTSIINQSKKLKDADYATMTDFFRKISKSIGRSQKNSVSGRTNKTFDNNVKYYKVNPLTDSIINDWYRKNRENSPF